MNGQNYDYTVAGFDGFFSRGNSEVVQDTLNDPGPASRSISFDRGQLSGRFPDVVKIGKSISLDGPGKNIVLSDGSVDRLLLGYQKDGF
jgi:hypothetical protein